MVDDTIKTEIVERFNDAYNVEYKYDVDTLQYFDIPINELLIIKMINNSMTNILEYKPENKIEFMELFNSLNLQN